MVTSFQAAGRIEERNASGYVVHAMYLQPMRHERIYSAVALGLTTCAPLLQEAMLLN